MAVFVKTTRFTGGFYFYLANIS